MSNQENTIYNKAIEYFGGNELSTTTWMNKYAAKGEETPDDMHKRMAKEFARIENKYPNSMPEEEIYDLFKKFKTIIPGGSVMSGCGTGDIVSLSNCFVIDSPKDSYSDIMETRNNQVQLMKRRGGVGKDLSNIRPKGVKVNNAAKTSTGVASFMDVDSALTQETSQMGRRGALMLSLSINHPDSEEFITKKQDLTKVTGANISVKVTDEFMTAVINDSDYILRFPVTTDISKLSYEQLDIPYNELNRTTLGGTTIYIKKVRAKELWDTLMKCAWNTAEPGVLFESIMHDYSPDGVYDDFKMISTNPCGEVTLGAFDSCRLIHLNLCSFIKNPFTDSAYIDEDELYRVAYKCMSLCDDLVDLEIEAVDNIISTVQANNEEVEIKLWNKIKETAINGRRAGVGFTAIADAVAMLNTRYGSSESMIIIDKLMSIKFKAELNNTIDMAKDRGCFKAYDISKEFPNGNGGNRWYKWVEETYPEEVHRMKKYGRRNISWSTVAPTGTVSIMTDTSSGVEPIFLPYYERKRKCMSDNDRVDFTDNMGINFTNFVVVHGGLKRWVELNIDKFSKTTNEWVLDDWKTAFEMSPYYKATASDIDWRDRVKLQGIIQKYVTHSISSTINLPKDTTQEEIADIYIEAWKCGNKGQTIYRDTCRDGILTSIESKKEVNNIVTNSIPKRPKSLSCKIVRFNNNHEKWVAVIGLKDDKPYEIFTGILDKTNIPTGVENGNIIKTKITKKVIDEDTQEIVDVKYNRYDLSYTDNNGQEIIVEGLSSVFNKEFWNYAKLVSGLLRHGMPLEYVINVINNLTFDNDTINSWKSGVTRALKKFLKDGVTSDACKNCGEKLRREGGCVVCPSCGYDKCGS